MFPNGSPSASHQERSRSSNAANEWLRVNTWSAQCSRQNQYRPPTNRSSKNKPSIKRMMKGLQQRKLGLVFRLVWQVGSGVRIEGPRPGEETRPNFQRVEP